MQFTDYIPTVNTVRGVLDFGLVFIIVYVVLKLLRGTRAVPTVIGIVILALLYWFAAASVFLPLTKNPVVSRELGTRHRAAIGITEGSDAVSVVVSEETGLITFVEGGQVKRHLDTNALRELLLSAMNVAVVQRKRAPTKTITESETEITLG